MQEAARNESAILSVAGVCLCTGTAQPIHKLKFLADTVKSCMKTLQQESARGDRWDIRYNNRICVELGASQPQNSKTAWNYWRKKCAQPHNIGRGTCIVNITFSYHTFISVTSGWFNVCLLRTWSWARLLNCRYFLKLQTNHSHRTRCGSAPVQTWQVPWKLYHT